MKLFDLFKMAVGNLARRKSRTFLTVLGIVIGTISIVLMVALGIGMQESVNAQFADLSSVNILDVSKGDNSSSSTRKNEDEDNGNLQDIDIDFFNTIEGVDVVAPIISTNIKFVSGKYESSVQVTGIEFDYLEALGYNLESTNPNGMETGVIFGTGAIEGFEEVEASSASGGNNNNTAGNNNNMAQFARDAGSGQRMPGMGAGMGMGDIDTDEETVYNVDIYTDRISMTLDTSFSPQGGNGTTNADVYAFTGYGILEEGDMTRDRSAYMDIDALIAYMDDYHLSMDTDPDEGYDSAYIYISDVDNIDAVKAYLEYYGYTASSNGDFIETMQGTIDTLQIALGAIGAVALLVAAIGITNTMIMAIHERKKEIGVMKVIGATIKDIKRLFLIEAALIGLLGGIVGIAFSVGLGQILGSNAFGSMATGGSRNPMGMMTISIPNWLIGVGMVFTTLVGIISGYIPARQAMNSSALEAIRTE